MTKNEFYKNWLEHFAIGIAPEDLKKYVVSTGNLIWHIFSWKLLDDSKFLEGDDARKAYNETNKSGAQYMEWFKYEKTHDITGELNSATALDKMVEVYVIASDFSWTYIKTHESNCGPYFMKL